MALGERPWSTVRALGVLVLWDPEPVVTGELGGVYTFGYDLRGTCQLPVHCLKVRMCVHSWRHVCTELQEMLQVEP